jgi:dTMP kinase
MSATVAGQFVSLEGPDGAGKSRAAGRLIEHLRARGHDVTLTREPGGTRLGEQIREILLSDSPIERSPQADALLFNAARSQLVEEVIAPALERGEVVVCDRFGGSTLAYQGYGAGVDLTALREVESFATQGTQPDLVLLLDVPVSVGLARRGQGDPSQLTRFEDQSRHDEAFHQRVRHGYRELAEADPERWRIVDANREPEAVDADVFRVVDEFLERSEPRRALARIQE